MKSLPLLSMYLRSQGIERRVASKDTSLRPWWKQGLLSCPAPRAPLQPSPVCPSDGGRGCSAPLCHGLQV